MTCVMKQKSAIFLFMCMAVLPTKIIRNRWLRTLHLFFAGLFAFVLPFICWGAQATPVIRMPEPTLSL